ncbi:Transcription factor lepE [Ceratocystis fimbriata CBS 114723]|uniref:Transcription factor lepE n=1 Tax=Ceratocystis fimbriata CBS 114723 TaxID=1035309 RepID=A0A2C5X425_9PEZI|nr:Transcription factor lepE [Ceratocystis fimbriata CBS 114723]
MAAGIGAVSGMGATGLGDYKPIGAMRNGEFVTLDDLVLRLERLEQAVVAKSPARTDNSASKMLNAASPKTIRQLTIKSDALRTRFFGQNSPRVLLNLFPQAKSLLANPSKVDGLRDLFITLENIHKYLQVENRKAVTPISVYVDSMLPISKRMADILPPQDICMPLLETYFDVSEVIFRFLHIQSFREKCDAFWQGKMPDDYFLPQLLTAVAIGSRFGSKGHGLSIERGDGVHIPTACALVRAWLDGLRGKQLVDITTLQTELLLLHCMRLSSLIRDHDAWTQLGYIVRMAMTMGLHRDPSEYDKMPVFTGELRRRLWYSILDMDLHVSMLCNLPALVRDGDYTCRQALNIDDSSIFEGMTELPTGKPIEQSTDSQVHCYAALTLPTRLRVSHVVHRIDNVRDYTEILYLGNKLERYLEDVNFVFPRHTIDARGLNRLWRLRVMMDMQVRRTLLALYRPFALGVSDAPAEIVQAYLRSSMVILHYMGEIDPERQYAPQVRDMYRQLLRQDIIQACFSLCFFVKNSNAISSQISSTGATFEDDPSPLVSNDVWAPARLISTVKSSLDFLVDGVGANDINDIVSLSVVFYSVQRSDHEAEDSTKGLEEGLEAVRSQCLRNMNISQSKQIDLSSMPAQPATMHMQHSATSGHTPMVVHNQLHSGMSPPDPMVLEQFQIRPNMFVGNEAIPNGLMQNADLLFWDFDNWSSMVPPGASPGEHAHGMARRETHQ